MQLALEITLGSATQIVMVVAPLLVFASLAFGKPMPLIFTTFELAAIIFSIFAVNSVIEDGESTWLEGLQLLLAYVIMGVAFFFYV
jgi:Ca2+:H+ antiporter